MTKIRFYLDRRTTRVDGSNPLKLAIEHRDKSAFINVTNVRVCGGEWSTKTRHVIGRPDRAELNAYLDHLLDCAQNTLREVAKLRDLDRLSALQLRDEIARRSATLTGAKAKNTPRLIEGVFVARFRKFMSEHNGNTAARYASTLSRMRAFCPGVDSFGFEDVTVEWLKKFETFLTKHAKKANGRAIHFRNIRAVFNDAIADEVTNCYPFRRFKIKHNQTRHRALSVEQLRTLMTCPVERWQRRYRDAFVLMFMLIGINPIDFVGLTGVDGERIEYQRAKTGKWYSVKVEPEAQEYIEKLKGKRNFLHPMDFRSNYRSYNQTLNEALADICAKQGLPKVTAYWARHSWATAAAYLDIPKETIAAALGHGQRTVTDIYIDFDRTKVDRANRRVLDFVLYGKE